MSLFGKKREKLTIMESTQTNNQTQTINYEAIENTPFTLVEKDNMYHIVLGDTAITKEAFKTKRRAKLFVKNMNWNTWTNVMCIIAEKVYNYKKESTNQN